MTTLYFWARLVIELILRVVWRAEATGRENVPLRGPLIVAANHVSYLDPPLLGAFCPRRVSYMAKKQLFDIPIFGAALRRVGAYPVSRDGSARAAIKRSLEVLQSGGAVGIFPEGTRNLDGAAQVHNGVALLASMADCPVIPAALRGTADAKKFARMHVIYGAPMRLPAGRKPTREELHAFSEDVMRAIRTLAENARVD